MGVVESKPVDISNNPHHSNNVRHGSGVNYDCEVIKEQQQRLSNQYQENENLRRRLALLEEEKVKNAEQRYYKEMEEKRATRIMEESEEKRKEEEMRKIEKEKAEQEKEAKENENKKQIPTVTFEEPNEEHEEEILKLFYRLDCDGSGYIDKEEFLNYINKYSDLPLGKERAIQLYQTIKDTTDAGTETAEQAGITLSDWKNYFAKEKILEQEETKTISTLSPEKLSAMTVDEFLALQSWTNNRIQGEVTGGLTKADTVKITLKAWAVQASEDKLEDHMRARWQPFASFKRRVDRATVMQSNKGLIQDILPGQYNLSELTRYKELGRVKPSRTIVQAVWIEGDGGANPSKLILPSHFDGKIEVDIATPETVGYYGASLGDGHAASTSLTLEQRHVLQDFTYGKEYLQKWVLGSAGGAALETHQFAHLDCPLGNFLETGHFILAKFLEEDPDSLEITAFMVPNQSTIYTPGGVMHTNNYLQGTWRTMLADGPINEAKMYRNDEKFNFII